MIFIHGLNLINSYLGKKINLSHCKVLVFSEAIAYQGLSKYFYSLNNDTGIRPDCNVVISRCDAKDFMIASKPVIETPTSRYYELFLKSGEYTGFSDQVGAYTFYSAMTSSTYDAFGILGGVGQNQSNSIQSDYTNIDNRYKAGELPKSEAGIENLGLAVFKNDKLVGELNAMETICHLMVSSELKNCILTIPNPFELGESIDISIELMKKTHHTVSMINGSAYIKTKIYLKAYGLSASNGIDYSSKENLALLENFASSYIQAQVSEYLYKTSKEFGSDIAQFGKYAASRILE